MSVRYLAVVAIAFAGCSKAAQVRPDVGPVSVAPAPAPAVVAVEEDADEFALETEPVEEGQRSEQPSMSPPVVLFGFDSTELSTSERKRLAAWASVVREQGVSKSPPAITIEGHCDERGTEEYNLVLGEKRASAVRTYLARMGLDKSKIRTVSYGESRPVRHDGSAEAFAANRRAEVKVDVSARNGTSEAPFAGR